MSQRVKVFLVSYQSPTGKQLFLPESVDFQTGNAICKQLAKSGKKPVLCRMTVDANWFASKSRKLRKRFRSVA